MTGGHHHRPPERREREREEESHDKCPTARRVSHFCVTVYYISSLHVAMCVHLDRFQLFKVGTARGLSWGTLIIVVIENLEQRAGKFASLGLLSLSSVFSVLIRHEAFAVVTLFFFEGEKWRGKEILLVLYILYSGSQNKQIR